MVNIDIAKQPLIQFIVFLSIGKEGIQMFAYGKEGNKSLVLGIAMAIILVTGFLDYYTGPELSFSLFYLIPISFLALHRGIKAGSIFLSSFFAAILWLLSEYITKEYSHIFYPLWNGLVRLGIFSTIGYIMVKLKENDQQLQANNIQLKSLNEEKNKYIGIAAHDLRNPISGIYSFLDLIIKTRGTQVSSEVYDMLILIRTLSNNTLNVLQNLLNVSIIESGKVELKSRKLDYVEFIKQQISFNRILAENKNINITFQTEKDNIIVNIDPHYFSEVIDNLLSNAIKYSYNISEIIVRLSLTDDNKVLTEVIDEGKGIPEKEQQQLFNYFHTTSTRPTGNEHSTGLGLAIVKSIITMHKGEIDVRSELNKGSNFYFTIGIENSFPPGQP